MKTEKFYWLVMPDSYHIMNNAIGCKYTDDAISKFKLNYKNGLYVFFETTPYSDELKTSHFPKIYYNPSLGLGKMLSEFQNMGELSRRSKLKKLQKIGRI
jgi:hypothetical protein